MISYTLEGNERGGNRQGGVVSRCGRGTLGDNLETTSNAHCTLTMGKHLHLQSGRAKRVHADVFANVAIKSIKYIKSTHRLIVSQTKAMHVRVDDRLLIM